LNLEVWPNNILEIQFLLRKKQTPRVLSSGD